MDSDCLRLSCAVVAALDDGIGNLHNHWKHAKVSSLANDVFISYWEMMDLS